MRPGPLLRRGRIRIAPLEALNPYRLRYGVSAPPLLKVEEDNLVEGELVEAYLHARSVKNYDR